MCVCFSSSPHVHGYFHNRSFKLLHLKKISVSRRNKLLQTWWVILDRKLRMAYTDQRSLNTCHRVWCWCYFCLVDLVLLLSCFISALSINLHPCISMQEPWRAHVCDIWEQQSSVKRYAAIICDLSVSIECELNQVRTWVWDVVWVRSGPTVDLPECL